MTPNLTFHTFRNDHPRSESCETDHMQRAITEQFRHDLCNLLRQAGRTLFDPLFPAELEDEFPDDLGCCNGRLLSGVVGWAQLDHITPYDSQSLQTC